MVGEAGKSMRPTRSSPARCPASRPRPWSPGRKTVEIDASLVYPVPGINTTLVTASRVVMRGPGRGTGSMKTRKHEDGSAGVPFDPHRRTSAGWPSPGVLVPPPSWARRPKVPVAARSDRSGSGMSSAPGSRQPDGRAMLFLKQIGAGYVSVGASPTCAPPEVSCRSRNATRTRHHRVEHRQQRRA